MIPKEWRDYTWKVRPLVVLVFLLVSPALALILQLIVSIEGVDWPAWVQAVGSVIGIFVAVGIARNQTRQIELQRLKDANDQELGRAERLHILFWEVEFAVKQLACQLDNDPQIKPGPETIEFLERFLQRALTNFDDDLESTRMRAIAEFRYALNSLIHSCHQRQQRNEPGNFPQDVKDALEITRKHLKRTAAWLKGRGITPIS